VLKESILLPKQTVPSSLDAMLNSSFMEITDSLFGEPTRRKNGSIPDAETLRPQRLNDLCSQCEAVS
jgi:hypothetical protein